MTTELDALEGKIDQVLALCRTLREQNRDLRRQLAGLDADHRALQGRMDAARGRLENLVTRLPEQ